MEPGLHSLLLCTDDNVVRVLRRVVSEVGIAIEHCPDADSAIQKLTRQRFEAVIVDCAAPAIASRILKGTRSAPANKRAITVAIIDDQSALKGAFELGAHFVLFRPVTLERTRTTFRAVRALMKRERRRHVRIPIELAVELDCGARKLRLVTADLGENGMAVKIKRGQKLPQSFLARFALPGTSDDIECQAEIAWEGNQVQGIRFRDLPLETSTQLKAWIGRQLAGEDSDEPAVSCKLTDLSSSACYLQTESPFPVRTRLQLLMKVGKLELQVEGIVRVMHPAVGMGIEFTQQTPDQRARVEEFIETLVNTEGAVPNIEVRPDAIDNNAATFSAEHITGNVGDPLLLLFRTRAGLPAELFQAELSKQRGIPQEAAALTS